MKRKRGSNEQAPSPFVVHSVEPDSLSPQDFVTHFDEAMVALKKLEMQQRGKRKVELRVKHSDPIQLVLAGDLHLGSFATNKEMVDDLRNYLLATPNAVLVLLGDEIEGFKAKYATTNLANTMPGLQQQLDYFYYSFFQPLAAAGKIAAVVSGYWGHNGWAHDDTTINIWQVMMRHNENVPMVANGGVIRVRFKNGKYTEVQVHHNPPGSSQIDPVHGLRKTAQKQNPANRPDNYASGHLHRAMTATENHPRARAINLVQAGTAKASVPGDNTDPFGEKLGLPHTDPWLQGIVMRPPKGRKNSKAYVPEVQFPFISSRQGLLVLSALELLNQTERTRSTEDILAQIYAQFPAPEVFYHPSRSSVSASPADQIGDLRRNMSTRNGDDKLNQGDIRPLYEAVTYEVNTRLPITVHPIANARLGSYHEKGDVLPVEAYVKQIAQDRYSFALFLRSILDAEAGQLPTRLQVLQRYIDMVNVMDGRVLGAMLDTGLGNKKWLKRLGELHELRPLAAGSYLSMQTNAKLLHHSSMIYMAVGSRPGFDNKGLYPFEALDKLQRYGSQSSTKGINRMYWLHSHNRPSVIVGGHMPVSGTSQFYDRSNLYTDTPTSISPGWWSKFVDTTGSRSKGGVPGQAAILLPANGRGDAMVIPTSSAEQTHYMKDAVTLYYGAQQLGMLDKLRPSRKGKRR